MFDERLELIGDKDFWVRVDSANLKVGLISKILYLYTKHPAQLSKRVEFKATKRAEQALCFDKGYPHVVKQRALKTYAKRFRLRVLVETGTFRGDMIEAMKGSFDRLYSIELNEEFYEKAKRRFKGNDRINLILGDSGRELKHVMSQIDQPVLLWLDGHYSGGKTAGIEKHTPIFEELEHVFNSPIEGHVIIVDDARCFGTDPAYPSAEELSDFIKSKRPDVDIIVEDDSIRMTPKQ